MLKKFRVRLNEKEYMVEMEDLTPGVQFAAPTAAPALTLVQNNAPAVPAAEAAPAPAASATKGEGKEITAPMPGTVLKVNVKVGDQVSVNQSLLILEAMKMENEIVSPISGTVTSIMVTNGQMVDVSELLVTVQG